MSNTSRQLIAAGLMALVVCTAAQGQSADGDSSGADTAESVATQSQPLSAVTVKAHYQALAEVVPANRSQLSVEVTGVVAEIPIDVASRVKAGQLLLRLDDSDLTLERDQAQAQLEAAQARASQARIRLERAQRLRDSEFISADDLLDRQTELMIRQAELSGFKVALSLANRRLGYARLTAPFDATITQRLAQVGQRLNPGQQVLTLVDLAPPHVIANIPAAELTALAAGSGFTLKTPRGSYPLTLVASAGAIDAQSRVSSARFTFSAATDLPGATGTLSWVRDRALIPVDLIVRRNGQLGIFIANSGCPRFVALPQADEGRPAPHQLAADTQVITSGHQRLTDCPQSP